MIAPGATPARPLDALTAQEVEPMDQVRRGALRIAGGYALLASLWITLTDPIVALQDDPGRPLEWGGWASLKGLAFVAVTAVALYTMVSRHGRQQVVAREHQQQILEEALAGWAAALDLRDHSTAEHTRRVTDLTERLATVLGVRGAALTAMRRGATLHDIGKMGVPDSVLSKAGPLDPDEWVQMRRHPELAVEFLSGLADLGDDVIDIPWCHHERYDGTGYPRGLAGDEIPLGARIFAVIDVYDALTSDRPYRPALDHRTAMEHVVAGAGTHFDPAVVDAFSDMLDGSSSDDAAPAAVVAPRLDPAGSAG